MVREAAKQIPLTYKENGGNARTVMLSEGLDFSNGVNTTAHTDANGKSILRRKRRPH